MRSSDDVHHALRQEDLEDLAIRLRRYAEHRKIANPHRAITCAVREAAEGKHRHLYGLNLSLFDFLAYIIEGTTPPMTEERNPMTDAAAKPRAVSGRRRDD